MAEDTLIQQGDFTSDGTDKIIALRSDVDWVEVINLTNIAGATQWAGVRWYWQREMTQDDATVEYHVAADQTISLSTAAAGYNGATYRGISLIDSSNPYSFTAAITNSTDATQPVYDTGDTNRLVDGSIVRVYSTAHWGVNGLDFSVDTITLDTSFRLANALQQAQGVVSGAGTWKYVAPNAFTYNMWNPKKRVIGNITQANPGVVTTLVDHEFDDYQQIRLKIPTIGGMTALDDVVVEITRINASTFSIGIDTTGYTAFNFPLPADAQATNSQAIPMGWTAGGANLAEAQANIGYIGMILGTSSDAGVALGSPGGTTGDVIKWRAGKSFRTDIG